jgi:hypothetical protein
VTRDRCHAASGAKFKRPLVGVIAGSVLLALVVGANLAVILLAVYIVR